MYTMSLAVGPCAVTLETDENLSFDAIDSLLSRGTFTVLTLMNAHMGAMVKYDNYDSECDCEEDILDTVVNNINNEEV